MKNQPRNLTVSPEFRPSLSRNLWKQTGAVAATAVLFLTPALTRHAQAQSWDNTPAGYFAEKLNTAGISGPLATGTASAAAITAALKAIVADVSNTSSANPDALVRYVLTQRAAAGGANDANTLASQLVTAAIQGLATSVYAGSGAANQNPLTEVNIVNLTYEAAKAAAVKVASTATGATPALQATSAATNVSTTLATIVKNAFSAGTPVFVDGNGAAASVADLAGQLVTKIATISYTAPGNSAVTIGSNPTVLGSLAGAILSKVSTSNLPAAGTAVANSYAAAVSYSGLSGANLNNAAAQLIKNTPAAAVANAFTALQTSNAITVANAGAFLKLLPAANVVAEATGVAKVLLAGNVQSGLTTLLNMPITAAVAATASTPAIPAFAQSNRGPIFSGIAAGAAAADPANAGSYLQQVIVKESDDTLKPANVVTSADRQALIVAVVNAVAPTSPSAVTDAITTFVTGTTGLGTPITGVYTTTATKLTLAQKIVNATVNGIAPGANRTASLQNAVSQMYRLAATTSAADEATMLISLSGATVVPSTDLDYINALRTIAATAATNWTAVSGNKIALANNALIGNLVSAAIKAQLAAGIISVDTADAGTIAGNVAGQFTGPTSLANKATIAAAAVNAAPSKLSDIVTTVIQQVDLQSNASAAAAINADADRKTLANTLAKANSAYSSDIATIVARTAATNGYLTMPGVDQLKTDYDVAVGVISANPANSTAVNAAITALFPSSGINNQVQFAQKVLSGAATAVANSAPALGAVAEANGIALSTFVTSGATLLQTNANLPGIIAGYVQATSAITATSIAPMLQGVLKPAGANGGQVVASIVSKLSIPGQAAALSGSAAVLVTGSSASVLGTIGNKVSLVLGTDAVNIGAVTNTLVAKIGDFLVANKTGATAAQIAAINTQITTRIGDLGTFAGNLANGVTDPTAIGNIIANTTTGAVGNVADLAALITSAPISITNPGGTKGGLVAYANKAMTSLSSGAVPFTQKFLAVESTTLSLAGSLNNVSDFASWIINGSAAKAQDIALATANFYAPGSLSGIVSLSGATGSTLATLVSTNAAKASVAAGLAQAVINVGGGIIPVEYAIGSIAGNFSTALATLYPTSSVRDTAISSLATSMAKVAPQYAWNVAKAVVGHLYNQTQRPALAKALVVAIGAKLTGPTANERLGLLVSACTDGLTSASDIAAVIAAAISAKPAAAYDIFGAAAAYASANGVTAAAIQSAMATNWGTYVPTTAVNGAITQAVGELTSPTGNGGHFYTPATGDLTGTETAVQNI